MDPNYYQAPPMNSRPSFFSPKMLLVGGIAIVAIIISVVLLLSSGGGNVKTLLSTAVARQTALLTIMQDSSERVTHPDLIKFNADAKLFITSDLSALKSSLSAYGVKEPSKEAVAAEADAETTERLEKAAQENRYDAAYADAVSQKMDSQQALLQEVYQEANSTVRPDIEAAYQHLQRLQELLQKINI